MQVELERPGRLVLGVELPVGLGYGVGGEHRVLLAVGGSLAHPGGVDLAVYDDARHSSLGIRTSPYASVSTPTAR
jgi:hypothetical protein